VRLPIGLQEAECNVSRTLLWSAEIQYNDRVKTDEWNTLMNTSNTVVLLDGGMGQELVRRSGQPPTAMWSARIMIDQPELVRDLHADFIRAGARVITLNAYAATPERLTEYGAADQFAKLQAAAVHAASQAREQCAIDAVKIAGCLPPLVASYHPSLAPPFAESVSTYRQIVAEQAAHVDLFLCETMGSAQEARAAATAALESGKPVWLAFTVSDDDSVTLRSGEPVGEALQALADLDVDAKLLNCSKPESISAAWSEFSTNHNAAKDPNMTSQSANKPASKRGMLGAYANGFTAIDNLLPGGTVSSLEARNDLGPDQYADFALDWIERGARIVGGCCEVGPTHIAALASKLSAANYVID